jgi:hypothetical protein
MSFLVGDYVTIESIAYKYSTYKKWIDENCPEYSYKWITSPNIYQDFRENDIFKIVCVAKHGGYFSDKLALIEKNGNVYIFGCEGLKLHKRNRGVLL